MGACCGKMIVVRGGGMPRGGDYETASRDQVLRATEGRIQQQENRGVSSRGAALLKAKGTEKHNEPTTNTDSHPGMTWRVGG